MSTGLKEEQLTVTVGHLWFNKVVFESYTPLTLQMVGYIVEEKSRNNSKCTNLSGYFSPI